MKVIDVVKAVEEYLNGKGPEPIVTVEFIKEHPRLFLKLCTALTVTCKKLCDNTKSYHYGITLTRNPNKDTVEKFIQKACKMLQREWFQQSEVQFAFECYNDQKELINEHIHVYVSAKSTLRMNDLKRSYPNNRIDMQKLYGDKILKTLNYIRKDVDCELTKQHYEQHGLQTHHNIA